MLVNERDTFTSKVTFFSEGVLSTVSCPHRSSPASCHLRDGDPGPQSHVGPVVKPRPHLLSGFSCSATFHTVRFFSLLSSCSLGLWGTSVSASSWSNS